MYIQIDKTNFVNKGAELMLQAVVQRLRKENDFNPNFVFGRGKVVEGTRDKLRINGFFDKFEFQRFKLPLQKYMDQKRLHHFGLVKEDKLDVILDAGGFQFGDQWEESYSQRGNEALKKYYKKHKENGVKIIFLPQAFGPFTKKLALEQIKFVFEVADMIYARDPISYQNLIDIFGKSDKIKLAPDFTMLVKPDIKLSIYKKVKDAVCIVPNAKMTTHTSSDVAKKYTSFLVSIVKHFVAKGEKVVLLNHEWEGDLKIINQINDTFDNRLTVMNDLDALEVKAVIGHSKLLISSRFHGVVSGLNQRIPTFCTSWSHKYTELLKLYELENAVLDVNQDIDLTIQQIEKFQKETATEEKLKEIEEMIESMWREIIYYVTI